MRTPAFLWPLLLAILLGACASERRAGGDGLFGQRKHRLHLGNEVASSGTVERDPADRLEQITPSAEEASGEPIAARPPEQAPVADASLVAGPNDVHWSAEAPVRTEPVPVPDQENLMPKKKWNHWAIPAFVVALGTALLGFGTTSSLAVLIGVVLALALAGIALRRGRAHELAGKGFALAALMIAMLTAIALAITIAAYGFE